MAVGLSGLRDFSCFVFEVRVLILKSADGCLEMIDVHL
jgi:hypothetical protein